MKGLSSRFDMINGKFQLSDGVSKAKDNIWFYCVFNRVRTYFEDFGGNFLSLTQKPISSLRQNRVFIVGNLQSGIEQYVGNVEVKSIDIGYTDRRNMNMIIEFNTLDEENNIQKGVTFI